MQKPLRLLICSVYFLTFLGCSGNPSVKDLLSDKPDRRGNALARLIEMKGENMDKLIPQLVLTLENQDSRLVDRAVDALSVIGQPAVPALKETLKNNDAYARLSAALTLGFIGEPASSAADDLASLLKDPHPLVRDEGARALGFIGPSAESAVPSLIDLLEDKNEDVREAAADSLDKIGTPEAKEALEKYQGSQGTS